MTCLSLGTEVRAAMPKTSTMIDMISTESHTIDVIDLVSRKKAIPTSSGVSTTIHMNSVSHDR